MNECLQFAGGVGHLTDDSGLVYMRARCYDPASGRFISEDPGQNGTNWYGYCFNNPITGIDPTGKDPWIFMGELLVAMASLLAGCLVMADLPLLAAALFVAAGVFLVLAIGEALDMVTNAIRGAQQEREINAPRGTTKDFWDIFRKAEGSAIPLDGVLAAIASEAIDYAWFESVGWDW